MAGLSYGCSEIVYINTHQQEKGVKSFFDFRPLIFMKNIHIETIFLYLN